MTEIPPVGRSEGSRLAFVGRDALKTPEIVARATVGLLNATGGEIWVGLTQERGRAVRVEPLANPADERKRLLAYLVDTIEPSLFPAEVGVEVCEAAEGSLLVVSAEPRDARRPYAFVRRGGRFFAIRIGDRTRPMTREEVLSYGPAPEPDDGLREATGKVAADREKAQGETGEEGQFWLRLEPAAEVDLDLRSSELRELLVDPGLTGNRREGWTFASTVHDPKLGSGHLETAPEEVRRVSIARNGGLTFSLPLRVLRFRGEDPEIWPPLLLEYPVSALRMARSIYRGRIPAAGRVIADLALFGCRGWMLRPGGRGPWFLSSLPQVFDEARDLILEKPFVFTAQEIEEEPDRCGIRLVERVYEAFGLGREEMPQGLGLEAGRLLFPGS